MLQVPENILEVFYELIIELSWKYLLSNRP